MQVLIVEDEAPAANQLKRLIQQYDNTIEIMDVLDSVSSAVKWLNNLKEPDLVFMDIQLADGLSFDIFMQAELKAPVIFTTAYDQYTLKAFKVNSVDYLLKPIEPMELAAALEKYKALHSKEQNYDRAAIDELIKSLVKPSYRERFMVKNGQQLYHIQTGEVLYSFAEDGLVFLVTTDGKKHIVDHKMEELEGMLDPKIYFRINRKYLINISSIQKIHTWFNSRLKLELLHSKDEEVIVSRDRVADFKQWLDN